MARDYYEGQEHWERSMKEKGNEPSEPEGTETKEKSPGRLEWKGEEYTVAKSAVQNRFTHSPGRKEVAQSTRQEAVASQEYIEEIRSMPPYPPSPKPLSRQYLRQLEHDLEQARIADAKVRLETMFTPLPYRS